MKIALIGATGFVGAPLLAELLGRGHQVTVLARTPAKIAAQAGVTVVQADALDAAQVAAAWPVRMPWSAPTTRAGPSPGSTTCFCREPMPSSPAPSKPA